MPAKKKPLTILVDSREKKEYSFPDFQTATSGLLVGDYALVDVPRIVVERKATPLELHGNLTKQRARFYRELDRAHELDTRLIILAEFSLESLFKQPKFAKLNPAMLVNTMTSIFLDYGFPIIYAGNRTQAQWWARKFFEYLSRRRPKP
jgi:ERCC4-type nuclease